MKLFSIHTVCLGDVLEVNFREADSRPTRGAVRITAYGPHTVEVADAQIPGEPRRILSYHYLNGEGAAEFISFGKPRHTGA